MHCILPVVASIDPCAQQQKLVKLVLPVENLMYSSVNLDGGYMKRSFVCLLWFLLSSETTASSVKKATSTRKLNCIWNSNMEITSNYIKGDWIMWFSGCKSAVYYFKKLIINEYNTKYMA
jgi:hypothetical protein